MKNFFNAIGVADMERVHSAVIGWMLSDDCEAFGSVVKSGLLCQLFGEEPSRVFSKIKVNVEVFNIDILIETEDKNDIKECWIIENKIKSSQHSDQLDKYVRIITERFKVIPEKNHHFCFLTLIDEKPQGDSQQRWKNFTYENLYFILANALVTGNKNHKHWIILNEYEKCIKELNDALSDFLDYPTNYPHVFTDGSKKKDEKDEQYLQHILGESDKYGRYISECGLETIFQKCYLSKLWNEYLTTTTKEHKWNISESRGNAALDIHYPMIEDKSTGEKYKTQIEIQNGTFKVQIFQDKDVNKTNQGDYFQNKWKDAFTTVKKNSYPCWQVNSPNSNSAGLYLSISKHIEEWWTKEPDELWKMIKICEAIRKQLIAQGNCEEVKP